MGSSCVFFTACDKQTSSQDIYHVYETLKNNHGESGFLKINIDMSKVVPQGHALGEDKAQIFPGIYDYYLDCSSGFFMSIFARKGNGTFLDNYTQEQKNNLLTKIESVSSRLSDLDGEIDVYETTSGNLNYKEVVRSYNLLISSLYELNFYFADLYYSQNSFNFTSYSKIMNCKTNLNDYLWYTLGLVSKVSFDYEVLNYIYANPLQDTTEWVNRSNYTKQTISIAQDLTQKLKQRNDDLTDYLPSTGSSTAHSVLSNMQLEQENYLDEYGLFVETKNSISVKEYVNLKTDEDRENYLNTLNMEKRAKFQIIFYFLDNNYSALVSGLRQVADYIKTS